MKFIINLIATAIGIGISLKFLIYPHIQVKTYNRCVEHHISVKSCIDISEQK